MKIRLSEIKARFAAPLMFADQLGCDPSIERIRPVESCGPGDLVFVDSRKFVGMALERNPSAIVTHPKLVSSFPPREGLGILVTPLVPMAHALIKSAYADRDFQNEQWPNRPDSAVIHATAQVAASAILSPNVVIGAGAKVGERTRVLGGVIIEEGATVGADCVIHSNAVIGYNCTLGDHVDIGPGTVIGSEGYGFAQDAKFRSYRIPQTGTVVIGDRVRIGANNCVDRGSYGETRIGAGTKTDNLCHFAHGVQIGENCLLTSMFCIAGSSVVGDRVVASGQVGVIDHVTICDDVWLLHRAGVVKDIETAGKYCALPLVPLETYKRNAIEASSLAELASQVRALKAQVDALTKG